MPYRRIPNTDVARLKALNQAYSKGKELPPFKLAFSQNTLNRIHAFLTAFDSGVRLYKQTHSTSITKNREYPTNFKKAKLYISHFIQVMNMAIARGEMPTSVRTYFGLPEHSNRVPLMNSEDDLIKWGEKIIAGETERVKRGMSPITNPTIAVVKVRYEQFLESCRSKNINKNNSSRILNDVAAMRKQADEIITAVWNEVEAHFAGLADEEMRKACAEYGVIYVYRRNERQQ